MGKHRNGLSITLIAEEELNSDALFLLVMNKTTETGSDLCSSLSPLSPPLSRFFSGMFFDGNHTYMIEPGGQGSRDVSTLIYMKMYVQALV